MIFSQSWMKKHRVIINMINKFLAFWLGHYIHIRAISLITLSQHRLPIETAIVRIEKIITSWKMIKKGLKKDMTNFLQTLNKLFNKKKRQINKSKRKTSLGKISLKKAIISSLNSLKKNCQSLYQQQ